MAADLTITTDRPEPDVAVITLLGELDLTTVARLDRELGDAQDGTSLVILDLSGLLFLDSTGLRSLMRASIRAEESGTRFVVTSPTEAAKKVFRIAGVEDRLEILDDPDDALTAT